MTGRARWQPQQVCFLFFPVEQILTLVRKTRLGDIQPFQCVFAPLHWGFQEARCVTQNSQTFSTCVCSKPRKDDFQSRSELFQNDKNLPLTFSKQSQHWEGEERVIQLLRPSLERVSGYLCIGHQGLPGSFWQMFLFILGTIFGSQLHFYRIHGGVCESKDTKILSCAGINGLKPW